jgi:hypothetical protein
MWLIFIKECWLNIDTIMCVGNRERRRLLIRPRRRREESSNNDIKEVILEGVSWILVAQGIDQ